jgi:hypothetical protein
MTLQHATLDALTIRGERAFRSVPVYAALKRMLLADAFRFRVPANGSVHARHDRVTFLNLTYWNARDPSDVLVDDTIEADVLAHAAWHHAARKALTGSGTPTPAALFLGEAVASAFDVLVVGQMLRQGRGNAFLDSQVPAMSAAALDAGLTTDAVEALLADMTEDPERAFGDLRCLLFDAALALVDCADVDAAAEALERFASHRFISLLHHYEVSNWVLYARAYAGAPRADDPALAMERAMRAAPSTLAWLREHWLPG